MTTPLPWPQARERAYTAPTPPVARVLPLMQTPGTVLAEPLYATAELPPATISAMDGWAVCGTGPWRIVGRVLAGATGRGIQPGQAEEIATGAWLPEGARAVLRREHGRVRAEDATPPTAAGCPGAPVALLDGTVADGTDLRRAGEECASGALLADAGSVLRPALLSLAAATGHDALRVIPRPQVRILVLGDELLDTGLPHDGRVRDALGPALPSWLTWAGAEVIGVQRVGDDAATLARAITGSGTELVVTTGATAAGPADHLHSVLGQLHAELVVDGVAVRPGHPMLAASMPGDSADGPRRWLVGLPGNPYAAVAGLVTLAVPLIARMSGRGLPASGRIRLDAAERGAGGDHRLVPVAPVGRGGGGGAWHALPFRGAGMLRGLAQASALAVIPPGGAPAGVELDRLDLP
ncbi:MAG: molybdopterin molybdotransferase MoeA [Actinomycetes bacterium]